MTPRILNTWADYFALSEPFSHIKNSSFRSGAHLVLIGWNSKNGEVVLRPQVALHPAILSPAELKHIADVVMTEESQKPADTLPPNFSIPSVG